jgi:DNA repair protein RadC
VEHSSGPRERLRLAGPRGLELADLLALVLVSGSRRESVFDLSRRLLEEGGPRALGSCRGVEEAMRVYGLGQAKAAQLVAALEIGRRLHDPGAREFPVLHQPAAVGRYLAPMGRLVREQFRCLYLDTANRLVRDEVISIGGLNASLVHPREVFLFAVQYSAATVVLAHNHPSGSLEPSPEDLALTRQLVQAGEIMGIRVLDHLIITAAGWFSFHEHGLLAPPARPAGGS